MHLLPTVFAGTCMMGTFAWITCDHKCKKEDKYCYFACAVQCATISVATAVTFPVSFPLITLYAFRNEWLNITNITNNDNVRVKPSDK
jgi:hypothetical protein